MIRHSFGTFLLFLLFVGDVFTDISVGIELILNDHVNWGLTVLSVVCLPSCGAILAEFFRACMYGGCCCCCCCCPSEVGMSDWCPLIGYHLYTAFT